jgi:hypothetical protein
MRWLSIILVAAVLAVGGWWLWNNNANLNGMIDQYVGNSDVLTLEARHTAQEIMEAHRDELLGNSKRSFQEPSLKFYPYLLLEVKYLTSDRKTREGVILWGLEDGEMVVNTDTWEKTHGFQDTLDADATRNDFKILNALAARNGSMSRDELLRELHAEPEAADPWIDSARQKHLIVQQGGSYYLHVENPKFLVTPQTKISQWLVTKPYSHASRVSARYSKNHIEKISKAAFGPEFTIRSTKEVFLPVYNIEVLNPDGSVLTSYWNALNGQRINPKYLKSAM